MKVKIIINKLSSHPWVPEKFSKDHNGGSSKVDASVGSCDRQYSHLTFIFHLKLATEKVPLFWCCPPINTDVLNVFLENTEEKNAANMCNIKRTPAWNTVNDDSLMNSLVACNHVNAGKTSIQTKTVVCSKQRMMQAFFSPCAQPFQVGRSRQHMSGMCIICMQVYSFLWWFYSESGIQFFKIFSIPINIKSDKGLSQGVTKWQHWGWARRH